MHSSLRQSAVSATSEHVAGQAEATSLSIDGMNLTQLHIHDFKTGEFSSNDPELDEWIKNEARKKHDLGRITTYVLHPWNSTDVLAFVSISMGQVRMSLDGKDSTPVGCLHVAYIARDKGHKGKELGKLVLQWSFVESRRHAKTIACRGVGLSCREHRQPWYTDQGFVCYDQKKDERGKLFHMFLDNRKDAATPPASPISSENDQPPRTNVQTFSRGTTRAPV